MYYKHKIGLIVLAYRVEELVGDTIRGLPDFVDKIYVIDDDSPDNTAGVVRALNHPLVKLIQHSTSRGPGAALSTGLKAALEDNVDIVVKVDGDGQMPLEQIEDLIHPIIEGKADYTKGDRLSSTEHHQVMPRFRLLGNTLLTWLTRIASGYWHVNDTQNGFIAISRQALRGIRLDLYPYYGYLNDLLIQLNLQNRRVLDVPMPARYGAEKSSIQLHIYIPKVSFFLLSGFLWRLKEQYILRRGKK